MEDYIWEVGAEDLSNAFKLSTMYFDSKQEVLDGFDIDPSTYRDYLNAERDALQLDNAYQILKVVNGEPEYRFNNPEEYVRIPEEDGWGSGRIKVEDDFREFIFGRELFGPFESPELENVCGISRQTYNNYGNEDRWIPEDVYESLFDFYQKIYSQEPDLTGDIHDKQRYLRGEENSILGEEMGLKEVLRTVDADPEKRFDLHMEGSQGIKMMKDFDDAKNVVVEEMDAVTPVVDVEDSDLTMMFGMLEQDGVLHKLDQDRYLVVI